MKKNKTIKVKVFKDRIIINLHPFIPYQNKENRLPAIKNNIKSPSPEFMPWRNYNLTLKRKREELYSLELDYSKCLFLTLGTNKEMKWNIFQNELKKFRDNLKYKFGSFEYIQKIECYRKGFNRFHTHYVLIFPNDVPIITREWLEKHWKHSYIDLQTTWKNKQYGLIEYFTLIKEKNTRNPNDKYYTKLPYGAKFLTTSTNLNNEYYGEYEWTNEQLNTLLKYAKVDGQIFYDGHYYGKDKYCLDKIYIHNSDIIDKI